MIDVVSTDDLRQLADTTDRYCVSIHLPTHAGRHDAAQDPIRLKNLLATARGELDTLGLPRRQIDELLAPADAARTDTDFWTTMANGLAVLIDTSGMRTFRLPTVPPELAVVAERFHLKPLLSSVTAGEVFYVLALSQGEVRLFRGNRFALDELPLGDIPASVVDAFPLDDREAQLQSHGGDRVGGGDVAAVFHGQGGGKDLERADLERFLHAVDRGFREFAGASTAPLVLAGVEHVVAHFRKLSHYGHVVDGEVRGDPERLSAADLHRNAWPLVEPLMDRAQRDALETIATASKPMVSALPHIVVSAADGRVDALVVPRGAQRWGTFSPDERIAIEHDARRPGDRDLLDIATIETLSHGGAVFIVPRDELPAHLPVAAVLRY